MYLSATAAYAAITLATFFDSGYAFTGSVLHSSLQRKASFSCQQPRAGLCVRMNAAPASQAPVSATPAAPGDHDLLLRVARGEKAERTPVWLMRQAGRYMKAFKEFSDKYPFRIRSETPEIAIELSLQPFRAFQTDGVIMFSDILTPLPSMGIEFDVVKGSGPVIFDPIRTADDVKKLKVIDDPDKSAPFLRPIISSLRKETEGKTTLLGFVGSPFTLAAYAIEGKANKNCFQTKKMMYNNPALLHSVLSHIADSIGVYACHQVDCGAQVLQLFESWAHHLSPDDFTHFAKPYADRVVSIIKAKADMICIDWSVDMAEARRILGPRVPVSGNVDPLILMGPEEKIREAVRDCIRKAGGQGHILNLGHGVIEPTPEAAHDPGTAKSTKEALREWCQALQPNSVREGQVAAFVDEARRFRLPGVHH